MNQDLAVKLGEFQVEIYWLHHAEKFAELAITAANICVTHGYNQQQSEA